MISRTKNAFSIYNKFGQALRSFSSSMSSVEQSIADKVKAGLKDVKHVEVKDVSGGCGSMYNIGVISSDFQGLSVVKQHQLIHKILKEEIKGWHGVNLSTKTN
uniref:Bola-like protein n=1 Tax=Polytomella parva TaxID=51329 RepID=A0A7S0VGM9_9CHLO|mmetsp:Transcript_32775/g.59388  ORF Transcript_32775/g.59388 Transcript_32775/m.59388 type:complete len:103 (+) Transcript_32775:51-359(+)